MKKLLLVLLTLMIYSCESRIKNDNETFDKVFAMTDFEIEIQNWGCFGGSTEYFLVTKKRNKFLLKSKRTEKSHFVSKIKMDSLKNFLKSKIGKEDNGNCTAVQYIRIGTFFKSVDYSHSYCRGYEATIINDLLNYYELVNDYEDESL